MKSVFESRKLKDIYKEIADLYQSDMRPWVLGYSGGKDSTTALQLIWAAIKQLPPRKRTKPIFVISSDTLVETPVIVDYITTNLNKINETAKEENLPFTAHKVLPKLEDSFWVKLIGQGYPAPSTKFRWCTERLKIRPANRFILDKVAKYGEVIMILGVRKGESSTRDQVLSLHQVKGSLLSRHSSLPNAFVYTPIVEFTTDDVWNYLLNVPSPWGSNNKDLLAIYKNSNAGECPLVVDTTTPSCGNSRFGCWVCTVVKKDKSMEGLIDSGEDWMIPLLEFRDLLAETQDPEKKAQYRSYKRKQGQVNFTNDGRIIRGPYKMEFCKELLRRVLLIHKKLRKEGPDSDFTAITYEELLEIRRIWMTERQDWDDSVSQIYKSVMGEELNCNKISTSFKSREKQLLEQVAKKHSVPLELVAKLLDTENQFYGMTKRAGIYGKIDSILKEEWRDEKTILKNLNGSNKQ